MARQQLSTISGFAEQSHASGSAPSPADATTLDRTTVMLHPYGNAEQHGQVRCGQRLARSGVIRGMVAPAESTLSTREGELSHEVKEAWMRSRDARGASYRALPNINLLTIDFTLQNNQRLRRRARGRDALLTPVTD
jgi:hypothetical protein